MTDVLSNSKELWLKLKEEADRSDENPVFKGLMKALHEQKQIVILEDCDHTNLMEKNDD